MMYVALPGGRLRCRFRLGLPVEQAIGKRIILILRGRREVSFTFMNVHENGINLAPGCVKSPSDD